MNKILSIAILSLVLAISGCRKEEPAAQCVTAVGNTGDVLELVMNGQTACYLPDVEYMLYVPGGSSDLYQWSTGDTTQTILVAEAGHYSVVVVRATGDEEALEVTIDTDCEAIYVPNAFTPNADGVNDVFRPVGANLCQFKIWVSDLGGFTIYETEDLHAGWDGAYDNKPMDAGMYIWNYEITFSNGEYQENTGFVELLR
jgi:gliding motility-associated-like protein